MINISNYNELIQIYDSKTTSVFRAFSIKDNKSVILKMLKDYDFNMKNLSGFKNEFDILLILENINGVINVLDFIRHEKNYVLILEDIFAKSMDMIDLTNISIKKFLSISVRLAEIIGEIHASNVIHKDINPSNILLNETSGQIKIIDFNIAKLLSSEKKDIVNPYVIEGNLAYISPEQTGRINSIVDFRSDIYSLGITFYQILTEKLPFDADDQMELIHCHMAKNPERPEIAIKNDTSDKKILEALSDIVMKMLSKSADDRYQSAWGLMADLEKCMSYVNEKGSIRNFSPGKNDTFINNLPQKLYGRNKEHKIIIQAFNRMCYNFENKNNKQSEIILITGYSGIGKTALIKDIFKSISPKNAYIIEGNYDLLKKGPFSGFAKAFNQLMDYLLKESETDLMKWKDKILKALGSNAQVIIEVIPLLEKIIGNQPTLTDMIPDDAEDRFLVVFEKFIRVFTSSKPLILFLDNLQWIDTASLKLLSFILKMPDISIFFIGAYRINEVWDSHPVSLCFKDIRKSNIRINYLKLNPLKLKHIQSYISETLNLSFINSFALAELILNKTRGNPFFVNEFITSMLNENLLFYDHKSKVWKQDFQKIKEKNLSENVVDIISLKIKKLDLSLQNILKFGACIGNSFEVSTISLISDYSEKEIIKLLKEAVAIDLLIPISKNIYVSSQKNYQAIKKYKFSHTRIQQAIYALIEDKEKPLLHRKIGKILFEKTPEDNLNDQIFKIVDQLNMGIEILFKNESSGNYLIERLSQARLNLTAGLKSKKSIAYESSLVYFRIGIALLPNNCFDNDYKLSLDLYTNAIESAYLCRNFEILETLSEKIFLSAKTLKDLMPIYEIKIKAYTAQNELKKAIKLALFVLNQSGIKFPKNPGKIRVYIAFIRIHLLLIGKNIDNLANINKTENEEMLAVSRVMSGISLAVYMANTNLFPLIVFRGILLSLKYGHSPLSPIVYASYGVILCSYFQDIKTGYKFGKLAIKLAEKFESREIKSWTEYLVNNFIMQWKKNIREHTNNLLKSFHKELEMGNLANAAFTIHLYCINLFITGTQLNELEEKMSKYSKKISQIRQKTVLNYNEIFRQTVLNLMGKSKDICQIKGIAYDEDKMIPIHEKTNDMTAMAILYLNKLILNFSFNEYENAKINALKCNKYINSIIGTTGLVIFYYYSSLTLLALYNNSNKKQKRSIIKEVLKNKKKIKYFASHAPSNFLHKYYIIKAEIFRVFKKDIKAVDYYDKAIELVKSNQYLNEEAQINELFAKFYISKKKYRLAYPYLKAARNCYEQWGAAAKVKLLDKSYPEILFGFFETETKISSNKTKESKESTIEQKNNDLDLGTLIKSLQTISKEIVFDKLLNKLMNIIIENAGAQRGVIILESKGDLFIEAEGFAHNSKCHSMKSLPVEKTDSIPIEIINYVSRTGDYVLIDDATAANKFVDSDYILNSKPYSILCIPLISQKKVIGSIYLENNLIKGAFSLNRLEILNIVASQVAISIENARLYQDLSILNKANLRFVPQEFIQLLNKENFSEINAGDCVKKEMSVLFTDIRNFTTFSENISPEDTFKFINGFLSRMEPLINENFGFIDKYIGDAIMALFGGTSDDALSAGIAILKRLHTYNQHRLFKGRMPVKVGIGINTGSLMIGTVGGKDRIDTTVISDSVNLASRLEGLTKQYGVSLLISKNTYLRLKNYNNYNIRKIGKVKVKGKSELITIYEVYDADPPDIILKKNQTINIFNESLDFFESGNSKEAINGFRNCLKQNPQDKIAQYYLKILNSNKINESFSYFNIPGFSNIKNVFQG